MSFVVRLLVNANIRPVAKLVTFPIILLTLGIFVFIINGLMLWLTSALAGALGLAFHVSGFWSAFFGALVVSVVSMLLNVVLRESSDSRADA